MYDIICFFVKCMTLLISHKRVRIHSDEYCTVVLYTTLPCARAFLPFPYCHVWSVTVMLEAARVRVPHSERLPWLQQNCPLPRVQGVGPSHPRLDAHKPSLLVAPHDHVQVFRVQLSVLFSQQTLGHGHKHHFGRGHESHAGKRPF